MNKKLSYLVVILIIINPTILPGQKSDFPYALKKSDYIIAGLGFSTLLYGQYRETLHPSLSLDDLTRLNRNDINPFDRSTTYNWNQDIHEASDITRSILVAAPALLFINNEINRDLGNIITYGVMYAETMLVAGGLTKLTKSVVMRKRPFLYNTDISQKEIEKLIAGRDVYDSFFSGHTSIGFASAVFLAKTYTHMYGNNTWSKVIWGSGLTLASVTGYLRYKSGRHFPTDIITGAVVGSAIGYLIPELHKKDSRFTGLSFATSGNSFRITYSF